LNREEQQTIVGLLFLLLGVIYWRTGVVYWRIEDIVSLTVVLMAVSFLGYLFFRSRFR